MSSSRIKFAAGVTAAFVGGVLFASSLDLVPWGHAQSSGTSRSRAREIPEAKGLADQGNAFVAIAERVTPAVVAIRAERDPRKAAQQRPQRRGQQQVPPGLEDFFEQFQQRGQAQPQESSGSGFIVSGDGYILTNNHVVEGADRLTVALTDHRTFKGTVVGRDPTTDVAVIKIEGNNLPTVPFGEDERTRIGEWVLAIGNPLGLDFTVTAGIVSAKGRSNELGPVRTQYQISDFIQTDAAINPGNSGGPLVNVRGEVIGINSMIASQTGFYSGYGFAIPISLAKNVMDDIIKHGRVRRAIIGVAINDVTPADAAVAGLKEIRGAKVGSYSNDDSPAKKAGIEEGDIIVRVDGKDVDKVSTLQRIVRSHEPGEVIDVDVMRYGTRKSYKIKLAEAPSDPQVASAARGEVPDSEGTASASADKLGIVVEPLPADFVQANNVPADRRGLRVTKVNPGGPAWRALGQNDIIFGITFPAKRAIRSVADLQAVLKGLKDGDYLGLQVLGIFPNADGSVTQQTRIVNVKVGSE